jgi:hypothetical protein
MQPAMRIPGMRLASALLLPAVLGSSLFAQTSALTVPRNIAQLTQQAAEIVLGRVVAVRVEPHPQLSNLTTVVVTLGIEKSLKGNHSSSLTFRQFVWDIRDKQNAAGYRKGQELLLLLNPTSMYGLTSPVGMSQGRFQISRDAQGNLTAINGFGNVGLFANVASQTKRAGLRLSPSAATVVNQHRNGPVSLGDLEEVITLFAGAAR